MRMPLGLLAIAALAVACPRHDEAGGAPKPAGAAAPQASPGAPSAADASAKESERETACVDQWLREHKLDQFGNPEGTMYPGGTPLFNEATGERMPRLPYVYGRQPEAKKACHPASP